MSGLIDYKDTITLVVTGLNDYADSSEIEETAQVPALVVMQTAFSHDNNVDNIESDAYVFVDPTDEFVIENHHRLEGMYCVVQKYGEPQTSAWFKVIQSQTSDDILLNNETDNIMLLLKKSASLYDVS